MSKILKYKWHDFFNIVNNVALFEMNQFIKIVMQVEILKTTKRK